MGPPNKLAEMLRAGKVAIGAANAFPAAGIIECMCPGWDFVWIDGQHGQMSYDSVLSATRTATSIGVESMIRVPGHDPGTLLLFADMAPSAIMIPMVNTAEQARAVVSALRFPPLGSRSYGGRRIGDLYGRDYYKDRELLVIPQIETAESVKNAKEIAAVAGVDGLFFGATDLKLSLGVPITTPETKDPRLREMMAGVAEIAHAAGKFAGAVTYDPEAFEAAMEMGYQLLAGGVDVIFLRTLAGQRLADLRRRAQARKG